jgi:hypothetical protein
MATKPEKNSDDQFVDIPDDRLDQIEKSEHQDKAEKKSRRKPTASRKAKQAQGASSSEAKKPKKAPEKVPEKPKPSREDLLADIRQTLVSEEEVEEPKGFFGRIKGRLKSFSKPKTQEVEVQAQAKSELDIPEDLQELVLQPKPKKKKKSSSTKQEEKAIQEFFSDLEALADVVLSENVPETVEETETLPEEQKLDEIARAPKLPARTEAKVDIDFEKVRDIALQELDETQIEPTVERKTQLKEEVRETIREARPFERILLVVVIALTAGVLLFSGVFIIVRSIPLASPTPTVAVNLEDQIYPTHLDLPGGWGFNLGQGRVIDGKWSPKGAEWLTGTEVSRWVALPWSLQLEAVLRTLKAEDQIELTMSNLDRLEYKVHSIQQMSMAEIQAVDPKKPSLLIILFEEDGTTDTHWVVTALP